MKILVVGSGAREHTIVWKLAQSPRVTAVFVAPGNAGTAEIATNLPIDAGDIEALAAAVKDNRIDLAVIGPEAPLAAGIVDRFQTLGIPVFGPSQRATEIESSKVFAKDFMTANGIPCAGSIPFSDHAAAADHVRRQSPPIVVKVDGLAAGKGVVVAGSVEEALTALDDFMIGGKVGAAGGRVVIEEYLAGHEMSSFVVTDGETVVPLASACDYKRIGDGDQGANTGGMGSYCPPPFLTAALAETVQETIMKPAVEALAREGRRYSGFLYGGLMLTGDGPKVIEYNARLGDPETQVVLPLLKTDLVDVIMAVIEGKLETLALEMHPGACVGVVIASGGYPAAYRTGFPVSGLGEVDEDVMVFHAGTKRDAVSGEVVTSGGRVLTVAARGATVAAAREKVYANISRIRFEGSYYRKDIALLAEE